MQARVGLPLVLIALLTIIPLLFLIGTFISLRYTYPNHLNSILPHFIKSILFLQMHLLLILSLNILPLLGLHSHFCYTHFLEMFLKCPTFLTIKYSRCYTHSINIFLQFHGYPMIRINIKDSSPLKSSTITSC